MKYFHFTLGPVQSFVAQARRTRDFWAGSFILSWLSAVAMLAVREQGGEILFPKPDEAFMAALKNGGREPQQGNILNRFKAMVNNGSFDPELVDGAVRRAWQKLAEQVWQADFAHLIDQKHRKIWERQIKQFWDIQWALVDNTTTTNTLDRMKNWRTYLPPNEPGIKCMMMDGWQELSGAKRPGRNADDPKGPEQFWKEIRESDRAGMATDLREGEMLCAIAFVKRRFVRYFKNLQIDMPGNWKIRGWKLPSGVPSVQYMAAAPWLAKLLEATKKHNLERQMWEFHDAACTLTGEYDEWTTDILCVQEADGNKKWKALDGAIFFDFILENPEFGAKKRSKTKPKIYYTNLRHCARPLIWSQFHPSTLYCLWMAINLVFT